MPGGGDMKPKDVMGYKMPQGPSNIGDAKGPGLHGDNADCGCDGTSARLSGKPGIGGTNHGNNGTQGSH